MPSKDTNTIMTLNHKCEESFKAYVAKNRFAEPIYVTRPNLPDLETYRRTLEPAWAAQWLTNDGCLHQRLEQELTSLLGIDHLRLFCNGTIALLTALQALNLKSGNVITTPFTFPATVNILHWNGLRPIFADIEPDTYNLDPNKVEALIDDDTRAILPVHVYGRPCDVANFARIEEQYGVPVIYDAAHAFGVKHQGQSILRWGAASMLSFHATKLFTTAEGGALAIADSGLYDKIKLLKNFGIANEDTVIAPGINGKMSELQAALGLTQLSTVAHEIEGRRRVAQCYQKKLTSTSGLTLPQLNPPDIVPNYAYFPIRVKAELFGMSRDELYDALRLFNVYARKYFYPLCSGFEWCRQDPATLPVADKAAREVLCLPIYGTLRPNEAEDIAEIIMRLGEYAWENDDSQ